MMYNTAGNASSHGGAAANPPENPIISYPLLHHHHQVQQQQQPIMVPLIHSPTLPPFPVSVIGGIDGGGGDDDDFPRRDERFPQWSNRETRDFIEIRAQLEWDFTTSKRTKSLWETVVSRMREKGYRRTVDQCKGKWKNLVNRYKGHEASNVDNSQRCPFFEELHAVFTARASRMPPPQLDTQAPNTKGKKRLNDFPEFQSLEEFFAEVPEDSEEMGLDHSMNQRVVQKRKSKARKTGEVNEDYQIKNNSVVDDLREMMRDFMAQQQRIDSQWRESMERHAEQGELMEKEWRKKMEELERERLMMEKAWREREEERKKRDESRAEKRDALLTTLLNRLIRDESP